MKRSNMFKVLPLCVTMIYLSVTIISINRNMGFTHHENALKHRKANVLSSENKTQYCPTSSFDPYQLKGIAVQEFLVHLPVWTKSCIPLKFSQSLKFPQTALASFPGSGNTWSRHLIQQLTGVYVGSVFNDLLVRNQQPLGFHKWEHLVWNGSCIAIKTHEGWAGTTFQPEKYDKAILVIRDPHDTLLAEFKRIHWDVQSNTLQHSDIYADTHFQEFFPDHAKRWLWFYQAWLQSDLCTLVVQYERLQSHLHEQLVRIARFLGIHSERLRPRHIQCILENRGSSLKWPRARYVTSPFTESMNQTLAHYKQLIRQLLHSKHGITDIAF